MNTKVALCLLTLPLMANPPSVPSARVVERELEKEYEGRPLELKKEIPEIKIDIPREQLYFPRGKKFKSSVWKSTEMYRSPRKSFP